MTDPRHGHYKVSFSVSRGSDLIASGVRIKRTIDDVVDWYATAIRGAECKGATSFSARVKFSNKQAEDK